MSDEQQGGMAPEGAAAPPPPAQPTPPPGAPQAPMPGAGGVDTDDTGKMLAALSYIIGIIAIVLILIEPYKDQRFVRHHSIQAIALLVANVLAGIVFAIPFIGWIVGGVAYVAILVFAIMGLVKAFQGEYWEMPVVYGMVQQYI